MASQKRRPKPAPKLNPTDKKTVATKAALLEQLGKAPVVTAAVRSAGVGRSTYYKWRDEDPEFTRRADDAIADGRKLINDIAFSKLLQLIDNGSITAVIYWLKNNHPWFTERILHEHRHEHEHYLRGDGIMTPEQQVQITEALHRSGRADAMAFHNRETKRFMGEAGYEPPVSGPSVPPPKRSPDPPPRGPPRGKPAVNIADVLRRLKGL